MTWSKATLGQIADEVGGSIQTGPFGSQLHQSDYQSYGTPVVMPQNIVNDKITEDSIAYVDDVMVRKLSRHVLQVGDIVYPRRGELNKRAIISERESGWLCGTGCIKISLTNSPVLPSFLFYYLKQSQVVKWIENKAVGSTMLNLNTGILRSLEVEYPNYQTQQRIAEILSTYDRFIDNNNRRIALLEESIHLLYKEWFVRSRFPGYESVKVADGIPEGWSHKPLEEVCELIMGQSPPSEFYNTSEQGLPFHQGVSNFGNRFVSHEIYCTQLNRIAEAGDILCSVRAPVGRLNITLDKIIIGRGLSAIRNRDGYQSFQYYQLKTHFFQEDIIGNGSIFASVTKKQLSEQLMLVPSIEIVNKFENISKSIDKQITNLYLQTQKLKQARDLLLPRLINGSIAV